MTRVGIRRLALLAAVAMVAVSLTGLIPLGCAKRDAQPVAVESKTPVPAENAPIAVVPLPAVQPATHPAGEVVMRPMLQAQDKLAEGLARQHYAGVAVTPMEGKRSMQDQMMAGRAIAGAAGEMASAGKLYARGGGDQMVHRKVAAPPDYNKQQAETYDRIDENPWYVATQSPLSTFSVDVDTASYALVRRFLSEGKLPPPDSVRIEELINTMPYAYATPKDEKPFAVHTEVTACPWAAGHRLVRIGIKGKEIPIDQRPPCNLVFLLDTSGSMHQPNRLPLVKQALTALLSQLTAKDSVTLVTYAGSAGVVLEPTEGNATEAITQALERLQAGGSTNGAAGIQLAYDRAQSHFIKGGINRVLLCTDGDFNVGITSRGDLTRLIEEKASSGVYLSVLGFGMGNYKDSTLEELSRRGDGNYAYIDSFAEAKRSLVEQASGTLQTIAKDVKLQLEFNPARVAGYRLVGYENRILAHQDFNDDKKDAGDIGAGHTVTALYEVIPAGMPVPDMPSVDPLTYTVPVPQGGRVESTELLTLKLRYKQPDAGKVQGTSQLITTTVIDKGGMFEAASSNTRLAAAVAEFGMALRHSKHKGTASLRNVEQILANLPVEVKTADLRSLLTQAQALSPEFSAR